MEVTCGGWGTQRLEKAKKAWKVSPEPFFPSLVQGQMCSTHARGVLHVISQTGCHTGLPCSCETPIKAGGFGCPHLRGFMGVGHLAS